MIPLVKETYPNYDGKSRQQVIRKAWRVLPDSCKFAYVQMSRADREKALYLHRLTQIKEEILSNCAQTIGLGGLVDQYSLQHGQGNLGTVVKEIDKMIVEENPNSLLK